MKTKIIQFFFLVIAGLIVGWREWTSNTIILKEDAMYSFDQFQEVGSTSEASTVFIIFLLGTFVIFMMSNLRLVPIKMSFPNSV